MKVLTLASISMIMGVISCSQINAQTAAPNGEEDRPRMISLQIAPVGPVRLASFASGKAKVAPAKPAPKPTNPDGSPIAANPATEEEKPPESVKAAGGSTDFRVVTVPEDERPPHQLFIRTGASSYEQIICSQNALSAPIEFPFNGTMLAIYTQKRSADPSEPPKYAEFASIPLPEGDRKILVTVTKPLKTKKWTNPIVNAHDVTNLKAGSITIINTAVEQPIACVIDETKKLLPTTRGRLTFDPQEGKKVARVMMMSKYSEKDEYSGQASPFLDEYLRVNDNSRKVILAYSVSKKESKKGAKYLRSSIDF